TPPDVCRPGRPSTPLAYPTYRLKSRFRHKGFTLDECIRTRNAKPETEWGAILGPNESPQDHPLRRGTTESGNRRVGDLRVRDRIRESRGPQRDGRHRSERDLA